MVKHSNAVSRGLHDIGHCAKAQLRINTGTATPVRLPLRRFSPQQEENIIEPSTSHRSAQLV